MGMIARIPAYSAAIEAINRAAIEINQIGNQDAHNMTVFNAHVLGDEIVRMEKELHKSRQRLTRYFEGE